MTERYDPKLVEAAAQKLWSQKHNVDPAGWFIIDELAREEFRRDVRTVLAATDASGIAWLAPWEPTEAMFLASHEPDADVEWQRMRDACLAKSRGEGR